MENYFVKFILASEDNISYVDKITVPWDFINLASDNKNKDDIFVIDFNELIQDYIDYDFYHSAIKLINKNNYTKLYGISNDIDLIENFSDVNIKFVNSIIDCI